MKKQSPTRVWTATVGLVILLWLPLIARAQQIDWSQTAAGVNTRAAEIADGAQKLRTDISRENAVLAAELKKLRQTVTAKQAQRDAAQHTFEILAAEERAAKNALATATRRSGDIQAVIARAARDLATIQQNAPSAGSPPAQSALRQRIQHPTDVADMADLRDLVDLCFADLAASRQIRPATVRFVDQTGVEQQADALFLGRLNVYYRSEDTSGMLIPTAAGELVQPNGRLDWVDRRAINAYFNDDGARLPVDISGGAALERLEPRASLRDWLQSGGLLLWPLLFIAAIALLLFLERMITLMRVQGNTDKIMQQIKNLAAKQDWDQARRICEHHPNAPACRVLAAGLNNLSRADETLENILQEAILKEQPKLERFLPTLGVLAAIAPLLGLLGTVTGMIETFQVITRFGSSDPKLMAGGISEALITTQVGLAVALPILLGHHFLDRRMDRIMADMEEKALAFLGALRPDNGAATT